MPAPKGEGDALLVHARAAETCDPFDGPLAVHDEPFGAKGLPNARRICRKRRFFHVEDAPVCAAFQPFIEGKGLLPAEAVHKALVDAARRHIEVEMGGEDGDALSCR